MENLDEIYKYFKEPTTMIIINNNSKKVLESFINIVYKKIKSKKQTINSRKGLYYKLTNIKNTFIKIDFEFNSLQLTSSKANFIKDIMSVKTALTENESRLLCCTDFKKNENIDLKNMYRNHLNHIFDLVIFIDKNKIKLISYNTKSFQYYNDVGKEFNISKIVRSTKIKKISGIFN